MENYNQYFIDCLNNDSFIITTLTGSVNSDNDAAWFEYKVEFFGPILHPVDSSANDHYKDFFKAYIAQGLSWHVTKIWTRSYANSPDKTVSTVTLIFDSINKQGDLKMDFTLSNTNTLNASTCSVYANSPTYGSISLCEDTCAKRKEPDESADTKSRVVEGLGKLKLVTYKDGYKAKTIEVAKPEKIDFFGNGRGVKITYADGTSEKAVLAIDTAEERQEAAIAICTLKKLLADLTTQGYGSNLYNKLMEQTIKIDKKNKKEEADRKAKKVEENARKTKRAEKRRKKLIKKYAGILAEVVIQSGLATRKD